MNKKILLAIIFSSYLAMVNAQKGKTTISVGPLLSFPMAVHYQNDLSTGVGVEGTFQYNLSQKKCFVILSRCWCFSPTTRIAFNQPR